MFTVSRGVGTVDEDEDEDEGEDGDVLRGGRMVARCRGSRTKHA